MALKLQISIAKCDSSSYKLYGNSSARDYGVKNLTFSKNNKKIQPCVSMQVKCGVFESFKKAFKGSGFKWNQILFWKQDQGALSAIKAALDALYLKWGNFQSNGEVLKVQVHKGTNVVYKVYFKVTEGFESDGAEYVCEAVVWVVHESKEVVLRLRVFKGDVIDFIFNSVPQTLAFGFRFFWHLKMNTPEIDLPLSVDWRELGSVTGVRDQGPYGTCFAFSAISAIEAIHAIKSGELFVLSPQYLVDQVTPIPGNPVYGIRNNLLTAFQVALENGVPLEVDYPYIGEHQRSHHITNELFTIKIDGFVYLLPFDEAGLLTSVSKQPVSAGMLVDPSFADCNGKIYSGIPKEFSGVPTFHAITIVGYTIVNDLPCWIVKESSGIDNPTGGYVYVLRETGDPLGVGGINCFAMYPMILKRQSHLLRLLARFASRYIPGIVWSMINF